METGWKRAGRGLLGLVYPLRAVCMGCGTAAGCEEDWVCPECRQALASGWIGASPAPRGFDGAACAYAYRGPSAGIVRRMKYSGVKRLADFMAGDMLKAYRAIMPTGVDAVVPVPMHEKRLRERGYNHAALLARAVAEGLGLRVERQPCSMGGEDFSEYLDAPRKRPGIFIRIVSAIARGRFCSTIRHYRTDDYQCQHGFQSSSTGKTSNKASHLRIDGERQKGQYEPSQHAYAEITQYHLTTLIALCHVKLLFNSNCCCIV